MKYDRLAETISVFGYCWGFAFSFNGRVGDSSRELYYYYFFLFHVNLNLLLLFYFFVKKPFIYFCNDNMLLIFLCFLIYFLFLLINIGTTCLNWVLVN